MARLRDLYERAGQSVWYDNMRRDLLTTGRLRRMIEEDGLRGLTSNPTIFEKAVGAGHDYDDDIARLLPGRSAEEAALELMIADIRAAADVLRPVYDATGGADGFASLEMSPALARDTDGTIAMARRLFRALDRPNAMIKIAGTREGVPAVEQCLTEGINVNITLLFSVDSYEAVAQAYLRALERRSGDLSSAPASVASFFVSRVDARIDRMLGPGSPLRGKTGVANARVAYGRFRKLFSGPRWEALAARGARVQRPLWASTGTKDPSLPKTYYFDALLAQSTVDTLPDALYDALRGRADLEFRPFTEADIADARRLLGALPDFDLIAVELQDEGLRAFADSWNALLRTIDAKRIAKAS
jgi:transaldolase